MHHRSWITDECLDLPCRRSCRRSSGSPPSSAGSAPPVCPSVCQAKMLQQLLPWSLVGAVVPRPDGDWPAMTAHILISSSVQVASLLPSCKRDRSGLLERSRGETLADARWRWRRDQYEIAASNGIESTYKRGPEKTRQKGTNNLTFIQAARGTKLS